METTVHTIPAFDLTRQHARLLPELERAAHEVLASGRMILGPQVEALEREIAERCGVPEAVGVANGSDGLYLALRALGVGPGDEVVTTPFTFVATGTAILRAGARPVFADVDPDTLNVGAREIEPHLTDRTAAILVVHLFGNPVAMDEVMELARRHHLAVVEDMAQAIGASFAGQSVGSFGEAAVISFYPTKNLGGCGDGGMVLARSPEVAGRVRALRDHGQRRRYVCEDAHGVNSRLDELQAALLRVKLRHLDEFNGRRRALAARYRDALRGTPARLVGETPRGRSVYHQFTIRTAARDELAAFLAREGVGTAVYYPVPLHRQPAFASLPGIDRADCPHAEQASQEVLSLPVFPELTDEEADRVAGSIRAFFARP